MGGGSASDSHLRGLEKRNAFLGLRAADIPNVYVSSRQKANGYRKIDNPTHVAPFGGT
jgi:hypothetical protein